MTPRELRTLSALAVFLCAALPAAAGAVAFRAQPVLAVLLASEAQSFPTLTGLFFNHFTMTLVGLLLAGLAVTAYAATTHRREGEEPAVRLAKLLAATCGAALISVIYLALFVLATALPVYAKLTLR
ncbi:MAG: hypothetical protein RL303_984 [Verrucomicrobiota bacterium]|jgi:uncharacterized membrane protein YidH (DUF202 family)